MVWPGAIATVSQSLLKDSRNSGLGGRSLVCNRNPQIGTVVIGNEVEWDSFLQIVLDSSRVAASVGNHRWGLALELEVTFVGRIEQA